MDTQEPTRRSSRRGELLREKPYTVDPETGCWNAYVQTRAGYTTLSRGGKVYAAHRWMYEQHVGPIPEGLHLDHLCRNPACVNPAHLEPVTRHENIQRGWDARGRTGTVKQLESGRWRAMISYRCRRLHLGMHDTPEEAREAIVAFLAERGEVTERVR